METCRSPVMNSIRSPRILLAEDDNSMRTYIERALTNAGYEVSSVDRGTEAVPLLEKEHFDLLLSDIVMPEMDGIEATRTIRSLGNGKSQIPIIALTASAMLEVQEQIFEAGMNDYVTKPFDPDELYQKISLLIKDKA